MVVLKVSVWGRKQSEGQGTERNPSDTVLIKPQLAFHFKHENFKSSANCLHLPSVSYGRSAGTGVYIVFKVIFPFIWNLP